VRTVAVIALMILPLFSQTARDATRANADQPAGLVEGKFENAGAALRQLSIPFERIRLKDLERPARTYRVLFFPCGIGPAIEDAIDVRSHGIRLNAVTLTDDHYSVNRARVCGSIRQYVENGGAAYFSDLSYEYAQCAFSMFSFFDGFPNVGRAGTVELTHHGDLLAFTRLRHDTRTVLHSGWVAPESISGAVPLATGEFSTPRGERSGPVAALISRGKGTIAFSSHHEDRITELFRFLAYRLYHRDLVASLEERARENGQTVRIRIADRVLAGEAVRAYLVPLQSGMNTLYVSCAGDELSLDVFSSDSLLAAYSLDQREFLVDIPSDGDRTMRVHLYPSRGVRATPYALLAASGRRARPHVRYALYGAAAVACLAILILAIKTLFFTKRFRGRVRR